MTSAVGLVLVVACTAAPGPATTTPVRTPSRSASITTGPTSSPTPAGSSADWLTYAHDAGRTGNAPDAAAAGALHPLWRSQILDGAVYAQPLVFGNEVVVATENDSVYALSVKGGTILWRRHIGAPVPGDNLPCGNIDPSGITGTPVIDPASGTVFVVAFLDPGVHELLGISATTGKVVARTRVDPSRADPLVEQQRGALTLAHGNLYVPFGGLYGDCGPYHGWVVAVPTSGAGHIRSYRVPTGRAGGIWAPSGLTLGADGDLYAATGNSDATASFDFGDSVLRLSPELQLLGYFAPSEWATLNADDVDLGSVGPAIVRGDLVFQVGKQGVGYLLAAGHLGGIGGERFSGRVCDVGAFGATASAGSWIFVPCADGLAALRLHDGPSFSVAWRGPSFDAGPAILAGGAVWCVDINGGVLYGLDAASGRVISRVTIGPVSHFTSPAASGGDLFVAATSRVLAYSGA
jgi:outer membrane protein assembly factor BamB